MELLEFKEFRIASLEIAAKHCRENIYKLRKGD